MVSCNANLKPNKCLFRKVLKGNRRYQRGRQKSLSRKTDKTMANEMKRKTNIEHTTLHWKLKMFTLLWFLVFFHVKKSNFCEVLNMLEISEDENIRYWGQSLTNICKRLYAQSKIVLAQVNRFCLYKFISYTCFYVKFIKPLK